MWSSEVPSCTLTCGCAVRRQPARGWKLERESLHDLSTDSDMEALWIQFPGEPGAPDLSSPTGRTRLGVYPCGRPLNLLPAGSSRRATDRFGQVRCRHGGLESWVSPHLRHMHIHGPHPRGPVVRLEPRRDSGVALLVSSNTSRAPGQGVAQERTVVGPEGPLPVPCNVCRHGLRPKKEATQPSHPTHQRRVSEVDELRWDGSYSFCPK